MKKGLHIMNQIEQKQYMSPYYRNNPSIEF